FGDQTEDAEAGLLDVGGRQSVRRLVFTGGVLSNADIFDLNRYANSTRTQFLNWTFINNTAWDFAADTRGYTRGAAGEWFDTDWAVRVGTFQMPEVANGLDLDDDVLHAHGDQAELEVHPELFSARPMVLRFLGYRNVANMGDYRAALALAAHTDTVPNV